MSGVVGGAGDDGFDVEARLDGIDGPRPLPADLERELVELLVSGDPVAALAAASPELAVAVPVDLRDRLEASLAGAGAGAADGGGAVLPIDVRRRLARALSPGFSTRTGVLRVAAVIVAVLLVAGGLAFAAQDRGAGEARSTDLAVEPGADAHGDGLGFDRLPGIDDPSTLEGTTEAPAVVDAGPTTTAARPGATRPRPPVKAGEATLVAFDTCDAFLERTKTDALAAVGPYGLSDGQVAMGATSPGRPAAATAGPSGGEAPTSVEATSTASSADGASGTNVQEGGVDEPDLVKSDGRRIVAVSSGVLRILRARAGGDGVDQAGRLDLPTGAVGAQLLVSGNRALVFGTTDVQRTATSGTSADGRTTFTYVIREPRATVWTVDLSNEAAPEVISTLVLEGTIAASRLVRGRVRLVVTTTQIGPTWVTPRDGTQEAADEAAERNRQLVRDSSINDWTPSYRLLRGTDESTAETGRLCACDETLRPELFAGASTISVLTIDPAAPPGTAPDGTAAVQGWADTVYASLANLFVTTREWRAAPGAPTAVHRFEITDPARATYRGSGNVAGTPLNQFALSERAGHLRVATTASVDGGSTEAAVTVLAVRPDHLEKVGYVGGLGKGERIYAVRFLDDVGYVVTFRQIDPLYTVDLSVPSAPRAAGELKVPGFSSYLHPLPGGFLLGVGQDATDGGRATGSQVSTFDVRDLSAPTQVAKVSYGAGTSSEVQQDHHAFLLWQPARRAFVPLLRTEYEDGRSRTITWLSVLDVPADGRITEVGTITHDGRSSEEDRSGRWDYTRIRRSFVIGDMLYTFSESGMLASDLSTLAERSWLAFGTAG